jgi:Uma2 family endonuclease
MTLAINPTLMTTEELLALGENGVERELIRGQLREREMTRRNPNHSGTETNIATLLRNWVKTQARPRGKVFSGEAGFRIRKDPDTTVGIDVAYISPELAATNLKAAALIDGAPVLAVEILSPSDKQEDILDKVEVYLESGVKLIWVVEPVFRTISIYRPDAPPVMLNDADELTAHPHLPGFKTSVREVFDE